MSKKLTLLMLLLIASVATSCKNPNSDGAVDNETPGVSNKENHTQISPTDLQAELQGTWTRIDYPFSTYKFKNDTSLLIQEGQAETPSFRPFELSLNCPYNEELQVNLSRNEMVIIDAKYETCEVISVRNDTLRLGDLEGSYTILFTR